jgi:16S rRNA (guanine966-N2)-methyltransferase
LQDCRKGACRNGDCRGAGAEKQPAASWPFVTSLSTFYFHFLHFLQFCNVMRVIAGALKGRQLKAPTWEGLRPTSDKLRETLFNVLAGRVAGARVLDGYAGTGAVGIEAISRGAAHVTFVEQDRRALALVEENLARCGVRNGYAIIRAPVARALETLQADPAFVPFDIVLLDPPYDQPPARALTEAGSRDRLLAPGGILVLEHARREPSPESAGRLARTRLLTSGDSALSFYA